jgi:hypothetical protein
LIRPNSVQKAVKARSALKKTDLTLWSYVNTNSEIYGK